MRRPEHIQQGIADLPAITYGPRDRRAGTTGHPRLRRWIARWSAVAGAGLALIAFPFGCSRPHYRQQADQDSLRVIEERSHDPRWTVKLLGIEPDPRSRFADPYDRDHPPMPPDDPTAHEYLHCADGKRGWKHWHDHGDLDEVENPEWRTYLELNEDGVLVLDEQKSLDLARIHSRGYQQQLETLYLSALDLTFERFRFDTWFFAGTNTTWRHFGAHGNETNTLTQTNSTRASGPGSGAASGKLFTSGATLLVDFANSFVWQFAGTNTNHTNSIFNATFVQPLLRNAGREVVMERLTLTERSLLYAVRDHERYRQDFYVDVTTGAGRGISVTRRGGQFGAGLEGFTGQGGGFGGVVGGTQRGGFAATTAGGTGAAQVGGFFGLVQQRINIRNLEYNVAATADSMAQLEALQRAGRADIIQVDQARQRLQTAKSNLLQQQSSYESGLDQFKSQLGLPPNIKMDVDDSSFVFLQLMDPAIVVLQNRTDSVLSGVRELPQQPTAQHLKTAAQQAIALVGPARAAFVGVRDDFKKLDPALPNRLRLIEGEGSRTAFLEEMNKLKEDHAGLEKRFHDTSDALERLPSGPADDGLKQLQDRLTELSGQLLELSLMQTRARLEVVTLPTVGLTEDAAVKVALENELGLMNSRAQLVDAWKSIEFQADRLESDVNLTFNADVQTLPLGVNNNPLRFRSENSSFTLGLRFDAPLTRVSERNLYRESLLDYQAARRNFIATQDNLVSRLRAELRSDALNRNNFELRRSALVIALRQVDQTREKLNEPPRAGQAQVAATTARDLLEALVNLLDTQNAFISVWFNSEAVRRSFYRDIGLMRIGDDGIWIDAYRKTEDLKKGLDLSPPEPAKLPEPAKQAEKPTILRGVDTPQQAPPTPASELVELDHPAGR